MLHSELDGHDIWQYLDRLADDATWHAFRDADARLAFDAGFARQRTLDIRELNPALVSVAALDTLRDAWVTFTQTLLDADGKSARVPAEVDQLRSLLDMIVFRLSAFPVVLDADQTALTRLQSAAAVALEDLSASATEHLAVVTARRDELEARLSDREAEIAQLRSVLEQMTQRIVADETRLDAALVNQNEAFIAAQNDRDIRFRVQGEEHESRIASTLLSVSQQADSLRAEQVLAFDAARQDLDQRSQKALGEAQAVIRSLEATQTDVERLASRVTGSILARDYGSYATREWITGLVGYVVGVAVLISAAVYLASELASMHQDQPVSWGFVSLKLGLTTAAAAAAAVAIQFGSRSLSRANRSKRTELELRAMVPFLADVASEELTKAKLSFVERSFGGPDEPEVSSDDAKGIIEAVADVVKAIPRR